MKESSLDTLNFNLIVCTYKRACALKKLLESVELQTLYPNKILIIDGSPDDATKNSLEDQTFKNIVYYKVQEKDRGLTKQRNFGVSKISRDCEIVCFLDDDIILDPLYFEELLKAYKIYPKAIGVSGYITNETEWTKVDKTEKQSLNKFYFDGWSRVEGSRFSMRRKFGLAPDKDPGFMPDFSHGYSTGFLPPSGKIYEAEMLMGGLASYKTKLFKDMAFSSYFEGYGLYEDADFALRASKRGKLYVNTAATLAHHHDEEGRPNKFKYGKMVLRNGWYVWRVKFPNPTLKSKFKWHATAILLIIIRLSNVLTSSQKKEALNEFLGRIFGWLSLFFNPPKAAGRK